MEHFTSLIPNMTSWIVKWFTFYVLLPPINKIFSLKQVQGHRKERRKIRVWSKKKIMEKRCKFLLHSKIAFYLTIGRILTQSLLSIVQGHWKKNVHNLCIFYTFLIKKHWNFQLHINIVYDPMMCHELHTSHLGELIFFFKSYLLSRPYLLVRNGYKFKVDTKIACD